MKNTIILLVLIFSNALCAQSVVIPNDSHFYKPVIKKYQETIEAPNTAIESTALIQSAIDKVAKKGGGILTITASKNNATYIINKGVELKSNVHIKVDSNVIFKSTSTKKITLFSAGKNGTKRVTNFSMSCTKPNAFFTFDFTNRPSGKKRDFGAIAISLGGVQNFRLADINIKDNYTPYSAITVNLLEVFKTQYLFAKDGIVEHMKISKGHYGYGLIQCQAAINVLYRDLKGEGGATLRLETGAIGKAYLADKSITIDEVYGKNILCKNGQAAITLSPHTVINGKVFIDNLTAESCEAGAIIAAGFLSAKKGQKDKQGNAINGNIYGYFDTNSIISNLKVIYGTNAQLRPSRRPFVPCAQRNLIGIRKNPDAESYKGPTVAGIIYFAKGGTQTERGFYTVKTPSLELENFPIVDGRMENKKSVASTKEFINGCDINWNKRK